MNEEQLKQFDAALSAGAERRKQGLPVAKMPTDEAWLARLAKVQKLMTFIGWKTASLIHYQHTSLIGERRSWARMLFSGVVESGHGRTDSPSRCWAKDGQFDKAETYLREKARDKLTVEFFDQMLDTKLEETP